MAVHHRAVHLQGAGAALAQVVGGLIGIDIAVDALLRALLPQRHMTQKND
jgi:sorbitol-specific phosphotransferase system component IIBC